LAEALRSIGLSPSLVVPANRPELGLSAEAQRRAIAYREDKIAIATSKGLEAPLAVLPARRSGATDLTIFNSTAVIGSRRRIERKVVVVREWLEPTSVRHRLLAYRHRRGADAIVGVSSEVMSQWRSCIRGPAKQFVVRNWLEREYLDAARESAAGACAASAAAGSERSGILCIGRFNSWKGQEVLADAYERAFAPGDDRPLLRFVGAQQGTAFADRANELLERGRSWGWEVLPFTSDPAYYFQRAALLVVPSLKPEPFGTVMLEALAHGCRVIAFEGGGPSDVAIDFPGAVRTVKRDTGSLASALVTWWDEGGTALSTLESAQALDTLESHYSPEAGAASWRTIVNAIGI
jgi:glycosyltransferase involved in cell wall biosynthesis